MNAAYSSNNISVLILDVIQQFDRVCSKSSWRQVEVRIVRVLPYVSCPSGIGNVYPIEEDANAAGRRGEGFVGAVFDEAAGEGGETGEW